jgi:transcriptional regulator with XRE-family HTH domain
VQDDKEIHFGRYVHRLRADSGKSLKEFGALIGVGEKRMWAIEQMREPSVRETTYHRLARAAGMTVEEFDAQWRSTPSRHPMRHRAGMRRHQFRIIRVEADVYEAFTRRAQQDAPGRTPEQYIADLAKLNDLTEIKPLPSPAPSAAPAPSETRNSGKRRGRLGNHRGRRQGAS